MAELECQPTTQYTIYPCGIDSSDQLPLTVDNVTAVKGEVVNRLRDSTIAIEAELGIQPSGTYATVRARLDALDGILAGLLSGGAGISAIYEEGFLVRENVTSLNFIGAAVTATAGSQAGRVNITITATGGSGGAIGQVQETVAVTINGQTSFILSSTPQDETAVQMFVNGNKAQYGVDYTVSGTTVTYSGTVTLLTTDDVEFWYIISAGSSAGGETLGETLAIGNTTDGYDIILTSGDAIVSQSGVNAGDVVLRTGTATGIAGDIINNLINAGAGTSGSFIIQEDSSPAFTFNPNSTAYAGGENLLLFGNQNTSAVITKSDSTSVGTLAIIGQTNTAGNGGDLFLGAGQASVGNTGGSILIRTGRTSGIPTGDIEFDVADYIFNSDGGEIFVITSPITPEPRTLVRFSSANQAVDLAFDGGPDDNGDGRYFAITGQEAGNNQTGGPINITAGAGGPVSGAGGSVNIFAGDATGGNFDGGNVNIGFGTGTGTGSDGGVVINNLIYPSIDGINGQAIVTDGAGNLSFGNIVSGGVPVQETIAVTINGQTSFTLTYSPVIASTTQMFINGNKAQYISEFTVSGNIVTFSGLSLLTTDIVDFWYVRDGYLSGGGGESLSETLAIGNITDGYDIAISSGDVIDFLNEINIQRGGSSIITSDSSPAVTISVDTIINGKLTVSGLIDPTGLVLDTQSSVPGGTPASNKGTVWVRNDNKLVYTSDVGTDTVLGAGGGSGTLSETLDNGNITDGYDIVISTNDAINFLNEIDIQKNGTTLLSTSDGYMDIGDLSGGAIIEIDNTDVTINADTVIDGYVTSFGFILQEQTSVPGGIPASGYGTLWVRNDNTVIYTDDFGTDNILGANDGYALEKSTLNITSTTVNLTVSEHLNKSLRLNNSSPITVTVPNSSTQDFPLDTEIPIRQVNTGQVTLSAAGGVTINTAETLLTRTQHSQIMIKKVAANIWDMSGDMELS